MAFEATAAQLAVLWDAVSHDVYTESASDGRRLWGFRIDFAREGGAELFPGFAGAIVHAENNLGPVAAWFYPSFAELEAGWQAIFEATA
jgi:hypothetical protein